MAAKRSRDESEPPGKESKRAEVLDQAIQHITKVYGKGAIMQLDEDQVAAVEGDILE